MSRILPVVTIFFASGCATQVPLHEGKAQNNKTYDVEYLFEHDGCKVYRFYDLGKYVYFTNCRGETIVKTDSTEVRNTIKVKDR